MTFFSVKDYENRLHDPNKMHFNNSSNNFRFGKVGNELTGQIPSELGQLVDLEILWLGRFSLER